MKRLLLSIALVLNACGASGERLHTVGQCGCKPGNYKIVDSRYQLCNEYGEWEDGGAVAPVAK